MTVNALSRGALAGASFGLGVSVAETWLSAIQLFLMNVPPMNAFAVPMTLGTIVAGAVIGAALSPLRLLPSGWLWHLVALTALWTGVGVEITPSAAFFRIFSVGVPVLALMGVLAGHVVARFSRWLPVGLGVLLVAAGILAPEVGYRVFTKRPEAILAKHASAPANAPDVVLVVLDTVRARNLSAYGYKLLTSPNFDALADGGVLFLDATAPSNWSLPSHASLFTGLYPSVHGAHGESFRLQNGPPTLAETLGRAGWETVIFTANAWISDGLGLTRGFDWSDESWRSVQVGWSMTSLGRVMDRLGIGVQDKGGAIVADHFEHWLEKRPLDAPPSFVFLNFLEAHIPYHQVPRESISQFSKRPWSELRESSLTIMGDQFGGAGVDLGAVTPAATEMYDAGVHYSDALLERVVSALRRRGTLDRTLLIVLADHGELLGEHGAFGHGLSLYQEELHVPLLVRYPERVPAGMRVSVPVSTLGVFATVLDLVGVEAKVKPQFPSLLNVIEGRPAGGPIVAERFVRGDSKAQGAESPLMRQHTRFRAYREDHWKLVEDSEGHTFLFDLARDPREKDDLASSRPEKIAQLQSELATWSSAIGLPPLGTANTAVATPELDDAARERLRELGYIE
jgi:arylsulfatase A-like enzyme